MNSDLFYAATGYDDTPRHGRLGTVIDGITPELYYNQLQSILSMSREQGKEISIISNNCWGGITYHYLGIENKSPFINLAIDDEDYIKIVNNLDYYLDLTPRDGGLEFNRVNNTSYPVGILDDVRINFLHYKDFEEAKDKWECRKQRINKNHLFFMIYTEDKEMLHLFNGIGSNHKACFVPFKSNYKNAMTLISDELHEYFWELVNGAASGKYRFYNTLKLLTGDM